MTGLDIYQRTAAYEREAGSLRLQASDWKLLLAFEGRQTLDEIASGGKMPLEEAFSRAQRFLSQGWIEDSPITLNQYLKRTGALPPPPSKAVLEAKPEASAPAEVLASAVMEEATQSFREKPQARAQPHGPMRLSAVIDYITSQAEEAQLGPFLAYRVFLRVPPQLLLTEEISSVQLVNDAALVRSEELQEAIATAVDEVLRRSLPERIFAAA